MAIPATATITRVDGPAGRNSGSGKIVLWPPSGRGTDSYYNIVVAFRAGSEPPIILLTIRVG
eukprot:2431115-Pyramimonas_sp.AAC.1